MKATMTKNGLLVVQSESELESYALKQWMDKNHFGENIALMIDSSVLPMEFHINIDYDAINTPREEAIDIVRGNKKIRIYGVDYNDCISKKNKNYPDWEIVEKII